MAQYTVGLLPWFVSIWVDEPWKLVLWAVGIGFDLLLVLVFSGNKIGESVVEIVGAASDAQYSVGLLATGLASFVLLTGMFGLSVAFGYAGLPHLHAGRIPIRAALGHHRHRGPAPAGRARHRRQWPDSRDLPVPPAIA